MMYLTNNKCLTWLRYLYLLYCIVVKMIVKIALDSRAFIGVLLLVNLGFSQAFWLVANENSDVVFSSWNGSFINAFSFMMGTFIIYFSCVSATFYLIDVLLA
jgi:hypothetical protein